MPVHVQVHLERIPGSSNPSVVWWAESDNLPGFSAAEDTLPALLDSCRAAISDLVPGEEVKFLLAATPSSTVGDQSVETVAETHADSIARVVIAA